ncbi:hypothetical protein BGZ73_001570 [Actinomortierella ambigua]|nr:hypothetical protein BGZ73_001570 [Actinomortierella ambigua]
MFRFGSSANGGSKNASTTRGDATPPTPSSPVLTVSIPAIEDEDEKSLPGSSTRATFALPPPSLWDSSVSTDPDMPASTATAGTLGSLSSSSFSPPSSTTPTTPLSASPKGLASSDASKAKHQQQQQQQHQKQEPQHRRVLVEAAPATRGFARGGAGKGSISGGDRSKIPAGGVARTFPAFRGPTTNTTTTTATSSSSSVSGAGSGGALTASNGSAAATPTPTWLRSPPTAQGASSPSVPSTPTTPAGITHRTTTTATSSAAGHIGTQSALGYTPLASGTPPTTLNSAAANFTSPHHPPTPEPRPLNQATQNKTDDLPVWKQQQQDYASGKQRQGSGGSWFGGGGGGGGQEPSRSVVNSDSETEILFDSRGESTMNDMEEDERKYGQPTLRGFDRFPRRRSSSTSSLDTFSTRRKHHRGRGGGGGGEKRSLGGGWLTRLQKRYFIWKRQRRRLYSVIRMVVLALLSVAVVFTTLELLFGIDFGGDDDSLRAGGQGGGGGGGGGHAADGTKAQAKSFDYNLRDLRLRRKQSHKKRPPSVFDVQAQNFSRYFWELSTHDHLGGVSSIDINEDYMLSKAFAGAMQPTRVIPFYFRASEQFPKKMVTITTLITPDRFKVFCRLVHQYQGPISVATHIRQDQDPDEQFRILNELWATHAELGRFVDLHVIVDKIDFQLNMWRNIGRLFARTDYFMMLDVDFHIPSGFRQRLHENERIQELLEQGAALVVPAFEYSIDTDPKDSFYFPDTKRDLANLHEKGYIRVFHDFFPPGHNATDYSTWFGLSGVPFKGFFNSKNQPVAPPLPPMSPPVRFENGRMVPIPDDKQEPYKVTTFQPKYEPYIIVKREGTPWCDERFVGYGGNKAACLFEIYVSGIDFWVMPQDFLIHQFHDYRDNDRKNGRILNRQIFINFQQESCFKYLETMILTGEWYTPKADNLREQCQVFDGFLKTADALARNYEAKHPNSLLRHRIFVPDDHGDNSNSNNNNNNNNNHRGDDSRLLPPHHPIGHHRQGKGTGSTGDGSEDDDQFYQMLRGTIGLQGGKVWGGVTPKSYYVDPEAPFDTDTASFPSSQEPGQWTSDDQAPPPPPPAGDDGGDLDDDDEHIAAAEEDAKEDGSARPKDEADDEAAKDTHVDSSHLDAFREGRVVPGTVPFSFPRDGDQGLQQQEEEEEEGDDAAGEERVTQEGVDSGSTAQATQEQQDQGERENEASPQPVLENKENIGTEGSPGVGDHQWTPPAPIVDRSPAWLSSEDYKKVALGDGSSGSSSSSGNNDYKSFEQAAKTMEESVLEMLRPKPDSAK